MLLVACLFGWFVWPTPYEPIIVNGVVIGFRDTEALRHRGARVSRVREPNAPGGDDRGSADRGADLHSPRAAQRAGAGGPSPTASCLRRRPLRGDTRLIVWAPALGLARRTPRGYAFGRVLGWAAGARPRRSVLHRRCEAAAWSEPRPSGGVEAAPPLRERPLCRLSGEWFTVDVAWLSDPRVCRRGLACRVSLQ